jgi:hypothetical protein
MHELCSWRFDSASDFGRTAPLSSDSGAFFVDSPEESVGDGVRQRAGRRVLSLGVPEAPIAGELAREFELPDSTRVLRRLTGLISHGRLVLVFYRGNW